ncbi:hypothetical protein BFP97_10920 [Roseivirga sp. 4D4]|uniref:tetratricopeptide repeat-containing sensor histidine kinase n=1 Tax=Roseivirga sp. 4D4 TaxID=1889784 RepID=UPI000852A210|nr:tetratricopeptide repeat protein [Roseivirga sp. 4D4]OEK01999.1 hypothetical protein BFP97_10920 [Roseivirga sp. 4D4]
MSIALGLCLPCLIKAQSNNVDSLKLEFNRTGNPETGLDLILSLFNSQKDSARLYLNRIDPEQLDMDQFIRFQLYRGYNHRLSARYDSAIRVYIDLLPIVSELDQPIKEADINDRIADVYIQLREVDQATSYFNQAISIREENGLTSELAKSYYALGSLQWRSGNSEEAIKNYKKGVASIDGDSQISLLANLYYMLGNSYNKPTSIDSALIYFQRAKELYDQVGPDQMKIAVSNELAKLLVLEAKYSEAILILKENMETIRSFKDPQYYIRAYGILIDAYKGLGDYRQALAYKESQYDTATFLLQKQNTQSIAKITEDYRTDKQLDQAEEQAFFATRRARIFGIVIIIMIVIFIIAYLLFSRAIQKKKLENLQAMVLGEENERKRVAKDLHDGIGVLLTSVKLRLTNFQDKVEAKDDFKNSLEQIDNACTEVRRISHNMIPASLTKLGLQEAILDLLDNVQASTDIVIEEALSYEEGAYDESKEVLIYRVVQELINNSLKYADPTKLSIELAKSKQDYVLIYQDDGKGFEKSKVKSGLGLRSIASRVDILKGKLTFESSPGQGASFNITIPHYG